MASSNHSSSITDPFSAIYKAQPGELPSSLSIESYYTKRAEHANAPDQSADFPSNPCQKSAHSHPKQTPNVFSPSLAGERDRGVRKRMLSNPESLLPPASIVTYSPRPQPKPSTSQCLVVDKDNVTIKYTQEEQVDPTHQCRFRTETAQSNLFKSPFQTPPRRSGIFFSPSRSLDTLTAKRIRPENITSSTHLVQTKSEVEAMLSMESHHRFLSAFSWSIIRGDACLDLDNQGLRTIPDLSKLVEEQKTVVGHLHDKVKATAIIEKMVNPGGISHRGANRQPITRAKSAPLATFLPKPTFTLFLSNNELTSSPFAKLERICYFQGLEHLSLRSNHLTELPVEIGNLKNLKVLNLAYNRLEFLPSSILKLLDCKLILNGNPWLQPPSPTPPLGSSARKTTLDDGQFRWLSQPHGVFYFATPAGTAVPVDGTLSPPFPSLVETCIRKICVTKDLEGEEETLLGLDNDIQHDRFPQPSSPMEPHSSGHQSPHPTLLLPVQLQNILADPGSYFYRCDLCTTTLALKPGALPQKNRPHPQQAFQFRLIDQHAGLLPLNQSEPDPQTPSQRIEPDYTSLIPIRWNVCHLNCCEEHLINV